MSIVETPIEGIKGGNHRTTGDGVHLVARNYRKGTRLDIHMHREAQLVYAAKGTMLKPRGGIRGAGVAAAASGDPGAVR